MRGKHISKPIEQIVNETKHLVSRGVKEIMLIAQELTYYGLDLYKSRELPKLLRELCKIEGLSWIRLHYAYPSKFPKEIFHVMAGEEKICNYLDMPLQHASDHVLKAMKRQITQKETRDLIAYAREIVPNIALRTTMLVGFPGETQQDIDELIGFISDVEFERLGVFEYSHEEGTAAYDAKDDVSIEEKSARAQAIMQVQQEISYRKNEKMVNNVYPVLFDRKEGDTFFGRTEFDSPEVDNEGTGQC